MRHTSLMPSAQVAYSDLLAAVLTATVPDRGISYFTRRVSRVIQNSPVMVIENSPPMV